MSSQSPFRLLRERDIALFWGTGVVSDVGTWMQAVVIGALVARVTGRASSTGLVMASAFLPQMIGAPIGGILADRYDRRRVYVSALLAQATATLGLGIAIAAGVRATAALSAMIMLQGLAGSIGQPSGVSVLYELAGPQHAAGIAALGATSWNSGRILGPTLGALLELWLGTAAVVIVNGVTFVALAVAIASIRRSFKVPARPRASVLSELVGGGREFWEHHTARFVFIRLALFQAFFIGFVGLIAIRAHQLGGDTSLNGWMSTFQGLGAVIGATTVSIWVGRFGRVRTYLTSVCIGTAALIAYGYTNVIPAAIVTLAVLGACTSTVFVTLNGALQRDMPNHQRGRFNAIIQASNGSLFTVAALSQGRLADHIGLARVFALAALIHFTLVMGPYFLHPLRFRVLDHPVVPVEGLAVHLPSRP